MKERDLSLDILRGIAIFTMIAADMSAYNLVEPHPFWFRAYGSIAAPTFIFLSGFMVSYTIAAKAYRLGYYIKRALATLLVTSLIDVLLWDIVPFTTFDVLYLIALSMPCIYLVSRLPRWLQLALILLIFLLTPVLQYYLGYVDVPADISVFKKDDAWPADGFAVLRQFLVDGWFPVFPWLGVSLLGAFVGAARFRVDAARFNARITLWGVILLLSGIGFWIVVMPGITTNEGFDGSPLSDNFYKVLISRESYSELFYPPTLFFMLTAMGFVLVLMRLVIHVKNNKVISVLSVYGRSSLLAYIMHIVFIVTFFQGLGHKSLWVFLLLYLAHALVVWLICFGVQRFKRGKQFPFLINFVLGG